MKSNFKMILFGTASALLIIAAIVAITINQRRKKETASEKMKPAAPARTAEEMKTEARIKTPEVIRTEKPEQRQPESAGKKISLDYDAYAELMSDRAHYAMLELTRKTFDELMRALETYYQGDHDASFALLELLFESADAREKPQLGMFLIERYLKYVGKKKAEEIVEIIKVEFPESPFAFLAQARLDMARNRSALAFKSIEKAFELGKDNTRLFYWLGMLKDFHGTDVQNQRIEQWFSERRRAYPENTGLCWAAFSYYQRHRRPDEALGVFEDFEKICPDKRLLANALGSICWVYQELGERQRGIEVLNRAIAIAPGDPWSHIARARYIKSDGNHQEAIGSYRDAIARAQSPELKAKIYRELAESYQALGNKEEMLKASQEALSVDPDNPRNLLSLARSYQYMGELDRALENCNKALSLKDEGRMSPHILSRCHYELSWIYLRQKDTEKFLENVEKATHVQLTNLLHPENTAFSWLLERYRQFRGKDAALTKADEFLEQYPDSPILYNQMSDFCRKIKQHEQAIAFAQKAIKLSESDTVTLESMRILSDIYWERKEPDKVREVIEEIVGKFPYDYRTYEALGNFYRKTNEHQKAIREYQIAYELAGPSWNKISILENMAQIYDGTGDTGKAIETIQKMVEIYPHAWIHYRLGEYYEKKEMPEQAMATYRKAIELAGNVDSKGHFWEKIARVQLKQGKTDDAIETMKEYVDRFSDNPRAHLRFASVYQQAEDYQDAEVEYREAIRLTGEDDRRKLRYMSRLAHMLTRRAKKPEEAISVAEEMIAIDVDSDHGHERLAEAYVSLERFENAARTYEELAQKAGGPENRRFARYTRRAAINYAKGGWENRALSLARNALWKAPDNYELNRNMGDVYRQCRHYSDALGSYEKALELAPEGKKEGIRKRIDQLRKEMAVPQEAPEKTGE